MMFEEDKAPFSPPQTLAVRETMQAFFQHWIENNKLAETWICHKTNASQLMTTFLQAQTVVLAEINNSDKTRWLEESLHKLEELERLQLKQHFLTGVMTWQSDNKGQIARVLNIETQENTKHRSSAHEVMIFMPQVGQCVSMKVNPTDILGKGLSNTRAFLNIINLSHAFITDELHTQLEAWLQCFKNQIHIHLQKNHDKTWFGKNKNTKHALIAYRTLLNDLAKKLVQMGIYDKSMDACRGILHMTDFLWSKNHAHPCVHIQQFSAQQASMIVFEPRSVKGSGNKEALWVKKLAKKHAWINNLPWQVLQRPRSLLNKDGEGLNIEKVTLVSIKKTACATPTQNQYAVDCTPIGEVSSIPVPLIRRDLAEQYKITLANQKGAYLGSQTHDDNPPFTKLEEIIFTQVEMLAPIITKPRRQKGITLLLMDVNLTRKAFSYKEFALSWLQDHVKANKEIRQILDRYAIYYDTAQKQSVYLDKTQTDFPTEQKKYQDAENYIRIHMEFHDPSIIYCNANIFPCKTKEDINGLKTGLKVSVERLEMLKETLCALDQTMYQQDISNIETVQAFLQSPSMGLYRSKKIPNNVAVAARQLSEKLRMPECPLKNDLHTSRKMQVEMLKILQSCLIVKSESFESLLASLYRVINIDFLGTLLIAPANKCLKHLFMTNETLSRWMWALSCILLSPCFIAGWLARFSMTLSAILFKIPRKFYYALQKKMGKDQNRSKQLTAAVSILFSATGQKKLNCKNTLDHALSVLLISGAMIHRAIHGERIANKTPLMTDDKKHSLEKTWADETIKYQRSLKATGLNIQY